MIRLVVFLFIPLFVSAQSLDEERDFWLNRYQRVSLPLEQCYITSPFGSRHDPFTAARSSHGGIDLRADKEEVYSMFDGIVIDTGNDSRSGLWIKISHGNYEVSYCHLESLYAFKGDSLYAGEPVACSGSSGRVTAPHLHITVRKNGHIIDPSILINYIKGVRSECLLHLSHDFLSLSFERKFFRRYCFLAMEQQRLHGIPASVTLSQMAYESSWGRSVSAREDNNFFGIKASSSWISQGKPYKVYADDRPDDKFCCYGSVEESVAHHSLILTGERYRRCRSYGETDYRAWLRGIKACGYATDPRYVEKCERLIRRYKLYLYDYYAVRHKN